MKKWISLFLCFVLVFSLTACTGKPAETTVPTETTVPPTTTEPAPTAAEIYSEAAAKVESAKGVLVSYSIDKQMTVGLDTYVESEDVTLSLSAPGTEEFIATVKRSFTWDPEYATSTFTESFGAETYYNKYNLTGEMTCAPMTAEEFCAQYLPAVLFTPDLYASVEFVDDTTIAFNDATAFESWLGNEHCVLVEASGTATVDAYGNLGESTYHAVFTQGGITYEWTITHKPMTGSLDISLPTDADRYTAVDYAGAMLVYDRALGLMLQATDYYVNHSEHVLITAAAVTYDSMVDVSSYGSGKDMVAQLDQYVQVADISTGETQSAAAVMEYKNSTYTVSSNGSTPAADRTVKASDVTDLCMTTITVNFPVVGSMEYPVYEDLGAVSLMTFDFPDSGANSYIRNVSSFMLQDSEILYDYSSKYAIEQCNGYIGIDNATGLPTAFGLNCTATFTIEGDDTLFNYEVSTSYEFGTAAGYETVMDQMPEPEEPEEKATPLLYHVTGENGEEMWLFGTIHVGDERMAFLPQEVLDAFAASDALALEYDSDAFDEQMENDEELIAKVQNHYFYTDGTTVADHISDDGLFNAAVKLARASGAYHKNLLIAKPVILANSIENSLARLARSVRSEYGAETILTDLAHEQDKEILSVESGEFQIGMLTGYSEALQEQLLLEAVDQDPWAYRVNMLELYELWCRGDEAELIAYLNEDADTSEMTEEELALYEEYWTAMSTDRNAGMLEVAIEYMKGDKLVFYAVGLAHLLAEDGLVNTLREAGYTVELVTYN